MNLNKNWLQVINGDLVMVVRQAADTTQSRRSYLKAMAGKTIVR